MDRLKAFVQMLKRGIGEKWDFVIVVDGREGSGKSTLALHMKAMYDGNYNLDHVLFDASAMVETMRTAPVGSCVLVDEAIISLYKREALKDFQTTLVKAFSIVRARNLFFILVLPNFNDLDPNIRNRANYRLYAHAKRGIRGYLQVYQPSRTPWTTGWSFQDLRWEYKFPALPEVFQRDYDVFKERSLMGALETMHKDIEKKVRQAQSRDEYGRVGTKLQEIYEHLDKHPDAKPKDVAKAVKCSVGYARSEIRAIREGDD